MSNCENCGEALTEYDENCREDLALIQKDLMGIEPRTFCAYCGISYIALSLRDTAALEAALRLLEEHG